MLAPVDDVEASTPTGHGVSESRIVIVEESRQPSDALKLSNLADDRALPSTVSKDVRACLSPLRRIIECGIIVEVNLLHNRGGRVFSVDERSGTLKLTGPRLICMAPHP